MDRRERPQADAAEEQAESVRSLLPNPRRLTDADPVETIEYANRAFAVGPDDAGRLLGDGEPEIPGAPRPDDAQTRAAMHEAMAEGKLQTALGLCRKLLEQHSDDPELSQAAADIQGRIRDREVEQLASSALAYLAAGEFELAGMIAAKIARIAPHDPRHRRLLSAVEGRHTTVNLSPPFQPLVRASEPFEPQEADSTEPPAEVGQPLPARRDHPAGQRLHVIAARLLSLVKPEEEARGSPPPARAGSSPDAVTASGVTGEHSLPNPAHQSESELPEPAIPILEESWDTPEPWHPGVPERAPTEREFARPQANAVEMPAGRHSQAAPEETSIPAPGTGPDGRAAERSGERLAEKTEAPESRGSSRRRDGRRGLPHLRTKNAHSSRSSPASLRGPAPAVARRTSGRRTGDVETLTAAAIDCFIQGRYPDARRAVAEALRLEPGNRKAAELRDILTAVR